jgi:hypothetical protein
MRSAVAYLVTFIAQGAYEYEFYVNGAVAQARSFEAGFATATLAHDDVVTVRGFSDKGCNALAAPVSMTVHNVPVISYDNNAPVICTGSATNIVLYSDIPATTTYTRGRWLMSVTGMGATEKLQASRIPIP